ncbi:glucan endo-1,3-beta-D-glucosidase [Capsicum annuum]|uniref:glucan endo-1,3-beta-D-glucosidase n=1 Tax=Capsicum annuum TaxID=4072 RepID=UPI0007BFA0CA|nr:glucan endo-1,3-beta-D-glucosidase [Capsicum annuum]
MEKLNVFLCILVLLLFISFCQGTRSGTWCVANGSVTDLELSAYLDKECEKPVRCRGIEPGKPCYLPPTLHSHASYMLNLEYKKGSGTCPEKLGMIIDNNPSYGNCKYH